jgi:hemerythrin-like metal-binding protein
MDRHHYPERLKHKLEHDRLLEQIFQLNQRLAAAEATVTDDVSEFLKDWLLNHILNTDRRYAPFFADGPRS